MYQQPHEKKHVKMARNIFDEIDFDKELEVFLLDGFKSDVWKYLVLLLQVKNAQNLFLNFCFTIMIVFTVIQVSIKFTKSPSSNMYKITNSTYTHTAKHTYTYMFIIYTHSKTHMNIHVETHIIHNIHTIMHVHVQ